MNFGQVGHHGLRVGLLGQQAPELRVMPAESVAGGIAMLADAGPQLLHFRDQLLARQRVEVGVHLAIIRPRSVDSTTP